MKETCKKLLAQVYELEGLLLVGYSRNELPFGLTEVIKAKTADLKKAIDALREPERAAEQEIHAAWPEKEVSLPPEVPFYTLDDTDEEEEIKIDKKIVKPLSTPKERKKPTFSLNDKFLFIRELFNQDATEFNTAINKLSTFESFTEAERYFINTLRIDPESETGARFLNMVAEYFEA